MKRGSIAALALCVTLCVPAVEAQADAGTQPSPIAQGLQLLRNGQAAEAKQAFDAAVKATPHSAEALTWRGVSENQLQQYASAATDFESAIRIDRAMLPAHYNLALSLIRLHKTDAAIEQLRIVVAAQPEATQALYNLAVLLESKSTYAEAAEQLRKAHAIEPQDKGVTLHLLVDSLKLSDAAETSPLVSELAEAATPAAMQREAGTALLEAGKFSEAVTLLSAAHDREPTAPGIDLLLARGLIGQRQDGAAITLLKGFAAPEKEAPEQAYLLGLAYLDQGATSEAADSFKTAARLDPKDGRPIYHLALLAATSPDNRSNAVQLLQSAIAREPANTTYSLTLARLLLAEDRAEEARSVLVQMHDSRDSEAQKYTLLGVALAATHQAAQAVPQLQKALQLDPSLALAENVLGFCFLQQGDYVRAAQAYGRASTLEPKRALYARDAALALARADQSVDATRFAERAVALEDSNARNHVLLGKLYVAAGRTPDAIHELLRAAELDPESDAACYLLARAYQQQGNRQQALAWSARLAALKQQHAASFGLQKKAASEAIRSSALLEGGAMSEQDAEPQ